MKPKQISEAYDLICQRETLKTKLNNSVQLSRFELILPSSIPNMIILAPGSTYSGPYDARLTEEEFQAVSGYLTTMWQARIDEITDRLTSLGVDIP